MTLRDELARAICEAGNVPGFKCTPCPHPVDGWCLGGRLRIQADACLALLRARIPGFDALIEGSAVVVPKEATQEMIEVEWPRTPGGTLAHDSWAAMLAASPYAQRGAK